MMDPTIEFVISVCLACLIAMVPLVIIRMIKGPTVMDRILSFDALAICIVGIMVLLSIRWNTVFYLDMVLLFSLFGFFGTIMFSYFLYKTYVPHPDSPEALNDD